MTFKNIFTRLFKIIYVACNCVLHSISIGQHYIYVFMHIYNVYTYIYASTYVHIFDLWTFLKHKCDNTVFFWNLIFSFNIYILDIFPCQYIYINPILFNYCIVFLSTKVLWFTSISGINVTFKLFLLFLRNIISGNVLEHDLYTYGSISLE